MSVGSVSAHPHPERVWLGKCVPESCTLSHGHYAWRSPNVPVTWGGPRAPESLYPSSNLYYISRTEATFMHKT